MSLDIELTDLELKHYNLFKDGKIEISKGTDEDIEAIFMYKNICICILDGYYFDANLDIVNIKREFLSFILDDKIYTANDFNCEKIVDLFKAKNTYFTYNCINYYYVDDDNIFTKKDDKFLKIDLVKFLSEIYICWIYDKKYFLEKYVKKI
jgi:hypothetical protein